MDNDVALSSIVSTTVSPRSKRSFNFADCARFAILALGIACWLSGIVPTSQMATSLLRLAPLLLFLGSVVVMVIIIAQSQVFDVAAQSLARLGRGHHLALFSCCIGVSAITTIFGNLDTTVVLLTPIMLALARQVRTSALALAMTTVWIANTASLLLPVSNLTNLLAVDRIALSAGAFGSKMWLPQLAALAATAGCLWWFYWRRKTRGSDRYRVPAALPPIRDRWLFCLSTAVCCGFIAAVLAGVAIAVISSTAAAILLAYCCWRRRELLSWQLLPWRLLVFVTGLFLLVPAVMSIGLDDVLTAIIGTGDGAIVRAGITGGVMSNMVNNLPAYVAIESAIPQGSPEALLGLLVGTNVAAVVTPWASAANLLWFDLVSKQPTGTQLNNRIQVPLPKFIATGAVLAILATGSGLLALIWLL